MREVNVGMIGGGTVGSGVYHAMQVNGGLLSSRIGIPVRLRKIAVKAFDEPRPYEIPRALMTTDWQSVVNDPAIDVVIEVIGGTSLAKTVILTALKLGKPVITANKALISAHGTELFAAARKTGANLYFEASVCGGIPIIKSLREGFVGNRITHLYGIVNGTCNYILTRMKQEGADFDAVLKDAQAQGFAEAEPSLDIDGHDSQHKIGILAWLAHGVWIDPKKIFVEGIRHITALDICFAEKLGYTIKLLGIIKSEKVSSKKQAAPRIQVSVYPTLVPNSHMLAQVNHVFNAVFVRGDIVGDTLFYGRGAGKDATASAVLSDIADAALDLKFASKLRRPPFPSPEDNRGSVLIKNFKNGDSIATKDDENGDTVRIKAEEYGDTVPIRDDEYGETIPIKDIFSRYFVRLNVVDRPGTIAKIANIFGLAKIGISSVIQPEGHEGESVPLILMLHDAPNGIVMKAIQKVASLPVIKGQPVVIRVETFE